MSGALVELTYAYNFEQFGSSTPDETALAFQIMLERYYESSVCMIGSIIAYPNNTVPDGMLLCDGGSHLRVDYPDLYAALHADFHVDADTFILPDLRDRFVVGSGGVYGLGGVGGNATHTLTESEMPAHVHAYDPVVIGDLDVEGAGVPQPNAAQIVPAITENTYSTGGGAAHNNLPPYYALVWAIVAR